MHVGKGDELDEIFQVHAASAFDSNLAVYGTLYTARGGYKSDDPSNSGKGSQYELAFGYFNTIRKHTSYELIGGLSYGQVLNSFNTIYQVRNNFIKPFIQGNYGYRSPFFDAVFNIRIGFLHLGGIKETTVDPFFIPFSEVEYIKRVQNSFLLEPGITLRFGYEPFKVQFHYGMSFNSNGYDYPQEGSIVSLGIIGMLNSSTKKKH